MANMSYCRFENTLSDLEDCYENWDGRDELSHDEERAKKRLLQVCQNIVGDYGEEEEDEEEDY